MRFKRLMSIGIAMPSVVVAMVLALAPTLSQAAAPPGPFFQGFEKNTNGWFDASNGGDGTITRVHSGYLSGDYANGIASAAGKWHARISGNPFTQCDQTQNGTPCFGPFTRWGGYSSTFPTGGYKTQTDVYLDVAWAATHLDYRFDWSSAINDTAGIQIRDFVFNAGTSPTGNGFFVNASTNATRSGAYPENPCPNPGPASTPSNPCRTPVLITTSGWYTFRHTFRNDAGFLAVDFDIFQVATGAHVASWTIHAGDSMTGVGGNRYGWFVIDEIPQLPIDNTLRTGLCDANNGEGQSNAKDSGSPLSCEGEGNPKGDVEQSDPESGTNFER